MLDKGELAADAVDGVVPNAVAGIVAAGVVPGVVAGTVGVGGDDKKAAKAGSLSFM